MSLPKLQSMVLEAGGQKFRAKQLAEWLYKRGAHDFAAMNNMPKALREQLAASYTIGRPRIIRRQDSANGETTKYLLEFADGTAIETVLMRHDYGNSVCVSTQAGCAMGCSFCASTLHGVVRNLTSGEILAQVVAMNDMLREEEGSHVNTIVIMGSGEPLMNYEAVLRFIRLLHEPYTLGLSYRNITVSTCGIVNRMYDLAQEEIPISLSLSLHAPNQPLREHLMPIAKKYDIKEVVAAADHYARQTGRRVTYEYILIDGVNDLEEHARELARLVQGQLASVNLIPINPVAERGFNRPSAEHVQRFAAVLSGYGVNVTVRREMGDDIQAACGQLRNRHLQEQVKR